MSILFFIIFACLIISLCVWLAVIFLYFRKETLDKITIFLVSLSAGALMGGAFLHLLPEASREVEIDKLYLMVLASFVFFLFYGKIVVLAALPQRELSCSHFRSHEFNRRRFA